MTDDRPSYEELVRELEEARRQVAALQAARTDWQRTEERLRRSRERLRRLAHDLNVRVKELNGLFELSDLISQAEDIQTVFEGALPILQRSWQFPEITWVRIVRGDQVFATPNFRDTPWKLSAPIQVHGAQAGSLEVGYLQERPEADEGPFLQEERNLLHAVAVRFGRFIERMEAEEALRRTREELEQRVRQRTAELAEANAALSKEIAEHRRSQETVAWLDLNLRGLIENTPDFVVLVDRQGKIQYANHGVGKVSAEELVGKSGFAFMLPASQRVCREAFERALRTGQPQQVQCVDVFDLYWDCRVVPVGEDESSRRAVVICTDVTERKRWEDRLRAEQRLLRRLLELQERERKLISHEIHDGFVQDVVGAQMMLDAATAALQAEGREVPDPLARVRQLLGRGLAEARRMIGELRPMIIDEEGIVEAIHYLAAKEKEDGTLLVDFRHDGPVRRLDPVLEGTLFRIVQEALTNAKRHSGADRVWIRLRESDGQIRLCIEDPGCGFDPRQLPDDRFGIRGIQERARLFGGQAVIESAPGEGTRVHVELPVMEPAGETVEGA